MWACWCLILLWPFSCCRRARFSSVSKADDQMLSVITQKNQEAQDRKQTQVVLEKHQMEIFFFLKPHSEPQIIPWWQRQLFGQKIRKNILRLTRDVNPAHSDFILKPYLAFSNRSSVGLEAGNYYFGKVVIISQNIYIYLYHSLELGAQKLPCCTVLLMLCDISPVDEAELITLLYSL